MSISEINDYVHNLGNAWEQHKQVNDARLAEIERKGSADGLYAEHLSRLSDVMDQQKSRLDLMETAQNRPALGSVVEAASHKSHEMADGGQYRKAFCTYLRKGMDAGLEGLQLKSLSVGSDADGGYLVTNTMAARINATVAELSPMRSLASVETISTDALDIIDDYNSAVSGWVAETDARTETDTPQIGKRSIPVNELYAQPKATQKLVDDSSVDIESWIAAKVAQTFAQKESAAFIGGDGVGKPKGILAYAAGTAWGQLEQVNSGSAGAVTADSLIKLFYSLKDAYQKRAAFLMNRSVVSTVRLLKDTTGQYIWQPGLAAGTPDSLMGCPVTLAADMPVAAANSLSVAVGDFQAGYQIVDRAGVRILRDPFTEKPFVKFYTTKRVGGAVLNFEAIKLLKLSA